MKNTDRKKEKTEWYKVKERWKVNECKKKRWMKERMLRRKKKEWKVWENANKNEKDF